MPTYPNPYERGIIKKDNNTSVGGSNDSDTYRVSIDDLADGYFEMTPQGRFTVLNHAMCRLLGDSRENLLAVEHPGFVVAYHKAEHRTTGHAAKPDRAPVERGLVEVVTPDGGQRTLEVTFQSKSAVEGSPGAFQGIARDVSALHPTAQQTPATEKTSCPLDEQNRLAERRYQAFLRFLPIPVMVMESDQTVTYLNPAFQKTFGWSLEEIKDGWPDFVPENQILKTVTGKASLIKTGALQNLETQRLTKDGRVLDVIYDGATFYDESNHPAGLVISLRDITQTKRDRLNSQTLFKISTALHSQRSLDELLLYVSQQVQHLLQVGRAHVILLDEEHQFFYFRADAVEDPDLVGNYSAMRIPVDVGVMGEVYRTQQPVIVNDYANTLLAAADKSTISRTHTRNMAQVPIWVEKKMIGLLCAVNKRSGDFDLADVSMLATIAGVVALPLENARINGQLQSSYQEISSLSKAKDCLIDHLSHELRTPLSVITASLHLLSQQSYFGQNEHAMRIVSRCWRNLNRLVDMQYQLEDIVQHPQHQIQHTLIALLEMCADELESLVSMESGESVARRIRQRIDAFFGPSEAIAETIRLGAFVTEILRRIKPLYDFRHIDLTTNIHDSGSILIPPDVLEKIIVGLVKNAIENTPDGGQVRVHVACDHDHMVLRISDTGIGITEEKKALLFENYFATNATRHYSTRKPYDFHAGGRGFDLLRIKLFSEKYHYKISMQSQRCSYIPREEDQCPGSILACSHLQKPEACFGNGGTVFTIEFVAHSTDCA